MKQLSFWIVGFLLWSSLSHQLLAQNPFFLWNHTIGGTNTDVCYDLVACPDGGYLLAGFSSSPPGFDKTTPTFTGADYWIIKIDAFGTPQWDKSYGGDHQDYLDDIIALPDGGFLLGGTSESSQSGDKSEDFRSLNGYSNKDYWVVRIDEHGEKLWDKTYGGIRDDWLRDMVVLPDGGFLLGGYSPSPAGFDKSEDSQGHFLAPDYWIIRVDEHGEKLWDKTYGSLQRNILEALVYLPNEGFLLVGHSQTTDDLGDKSEPGLGNSDYWVIKTDMEGNKVWDKVYGGSRFDIAQSAKLLDDGTALIAGLSGSDSSATKSENTLGFSEDFWVIAIDTEGNRVWDKTLGGAGGDRLLDCEIAPDGSIVLAGQSRSDASFYKSEDKRALNTYDADIWVIKTDAQGNKLWDKTLGGTADETVYGILVDAVGDVIVGGTSSSFRSGDKTEGVIGNKENSPDFWISKLSDGDPSQVVRAFLVNAETDEVIQEIHPNETINLLNIGTDFLTINVFTRHGTFESMRFDIEGPFVHEKTENQLPYALFGKNNNKGDFVGRHFPEGSYSLALTPYTGNNLGGESGGTFQFPFTIENRVPDLVNRLVLVNADTDEDIQEITDGLHIDVDQLGTNRFSIRAETQGTDVGSVLLELESDTFQVNTVENLAPYALFGGEPRTNYFGRNFPRGKYTIRATAFLGEDQTGSSSIPFEKSFEIIDDPINNLAVINTTTQEVTESLKSDMLLPCTGFFSIKAEVNKEVESVRFILHTHDDTLVNRVENFAPFTLMGEDMDGQVNPYKLLFRYDSYRLTVISYPQKDAKGTPQPAKTVQFKTWKNFRVNGFTLIDAGTDEEIGPLESWMRIKLPPGGISIRANTTDCVERVRLVIDQGVISDFNENYYYFEHRLHQDEKQAPYSLRGDENGDYAPWFPEPGYYRIYAYTYQTEDRRERFVSSKLLEFFIEADEDSTENSPVDVNIFPNPVFHDQLSIQKSPETTQISQIRILDQQGQVLIAVEAPEQEAKINTSSLAPGFYILEIKNDTDILRRRIIKQ